MIEMTLAGPPGEATHWTGRAMAKAAGISLRSVQRIWAAHGLQPHRVRTFKLSNDAKFAAKVQDIVGLYVNPPEHALVLSVDEKSQVQALRKPGISPERNNERLKPNNESRPRQAEEEKRRDQAARQAAEEQGWYEPARSANLASRKVACNELRNLRDRKTVNTLTACW